MDASERLAEALRELVAELKKDPAFNHRRFDGLGIKVTNALLAYDRGRAVREAERDLVEDVVKAYPYLGMSFSERIRRVIAARAGEGKP
jgi:hypothetical protein